MDILLACGFCGTPTDHTTLLEVLLAGGLVMPWYARYRFGRFVRRGLDRVRGRPTDDATVCPLPLDAEG